MYRGVHALAMPIAQNRAVTPFKIESSLRWLPLLLRVYAALTSCRAPTNKLSHGVKSGKLRGASLRGTAWDEVLDLQPARVVAVRWVVLLLSGRPQQGNQTHAVGGR